MAPRTGTRGPRAQRTPARTREAPGTRARGTAPTRPGGANALPSAHVAEIQRARLLAGAVRAVDEFGYTRAKVTEITQCSRVSRRTFYELFSNYEECALAVLDGALAHVRERLAAAELTGLPWRERMRGGLWTILCFLDAEPALARFCVVQSARGGPRIIERREQILSELTSLVDEGRSEGVRGSDCPPLTAEGLIGAALSILHARLSRREREPLTGLQNELMAMIVLPYLGPAAARQERKRPAPAPSVAHTAEGGGEATPHGTPQGAPPAGAQAGGGQAKVHGDPFQGIHMHLTYRTARVLEAVAELPGASNRIVGDHAGIPDQGQISKLLARLKRLGLLENGGEGAHSKGEAYAWQLTPTGRSVVQAIAMSTRHQRQAA